MLGKKSTVRSLILLVLMALPVWSAKVIGLEGEAWVNGKLGQVGMKVKTGDTLKTGVESALEVLLEEGTALRMQENALVAISLDAPKERKTRLWVQTGGALFVVRKGHDLQVNARDATAAVRGTIFYVKPMADGTPYFCTCNGTVEYQRGNGAPVRKTAAHHEAFIMDEKGTAQTAMGKDHNDQEIFELIYRMENPAAARDSVTSGKSVSK